MKRTAIALGGVAVWVSFGAAMAQQTVGIGGQEQACAGEFAMMMNIEMSAVRINGHDESAAGNTVVFLQTADDAHSANCEVDDYGNVLQVVKTGG